MDIGSVRPALAGVTTPVPRAPAQNEQAVRTDLPGPAAVTEPQKGEGAELNTRRGDERAASETAQSRRPEDTPEREVSREFELDPETQALVFKKIDVQSGDVVEQVPEEALLRMRQMVDAWSDGGSTRSRAPTGVDISA